jgi:hypothetical protein
VRTRGIIAFTAACLAIVAAPAGGGAQTQASLAFTPPVQVGPDAASTWEPTLLIDGFGNVFITARKDTSPSQLVVSPDDRSPTLTRSMSWLWVSTDGGQTFDNMHGLPLDLENHMWGYEADIAIDDAGHLYMADQNYADSSLTRWTVSGLGEFTFDYHRPALPTAQPVDDRPWLAAHGDGSVFYIAQAGTPLLNPFGRGGSGDAYGAGRYSVYHSSDGGSTFDLIGHSLNESGGCRPAADHRSGSTRAYIVCTNDGGAQGLIETPQNPGRVWAYASEDDGATWTQHPVGTYDAKFDTYDWPLVEVGPDGDVWALHIDTGDVVDGVVVTNRVNLYHSSDNGVTWSQQDITGEEGRYRWAGLTVSPQGKLGLAIQHRPDPASPWRVYASVFDPGSMPELVPLDVVDEAASPEPPSEIVGIDFAPDGTLGVAWTRVEPVGPLGSFRVYFSRSIAAG